jgi:hypothetical protein
MSWAEIDAGRPTPAPESGGRDRSGHAVIAIEAAAGTIARGRRGRQGRAPPCYHAIGARGVASRQDRVAGRPMGDWRKRWARACLRAGFASQDPTTLPIEQPTKFELVIVEPRFEHEILALDISQRAEPLPERLVYGISAEPTDPIHAPCRLCLGDERCCKEGTRPHEKASPIHY